MDIEQIYELGYLLKSDIEDKALLTQLEKISTEVVSSGQAKPIKLAYEIEKQNSAQFGWIQFKISDPKNLAKLSDALKMQDEILRFIIIKIPSKKLPPKESRRKKPDKLKSEKTENSFPSLSNKKLEEKLEEMVK